ncbi:hypothetical protein NE237_032642 [Protea cynaroides]|uniref:Uncharacterized protein n=1 Tax=Protea cynaroides TaxID=273540 RepID=A0A9Q0R3B0_9MAGN|nr:hypothetical protein NE237_032642 [Protea cynaroides]
MGTEPIQIEGEIQKQLDREIREIDDDVAEVIALAGSNTRTTMQTRSNETSQPYNQLPWGEQEMSACVNSNFQAISNSLMMSGSYNSSDPSVQMDINDYIHDHQHHPHEEQNKLNNKSEKWERRFLQVFNKPGKSSLINYCTFIIIIIIITHVYVQHCCH